MAAEVSELLGSVKKMVRSILLTDKNGLTGHQLQGIYSEFVGGTIPFKKLGYSSLDAYLRSVPDAARPRSDGTYQGVANEDTRHIASMVGKQKSRKKKPRISRRDLGGYQPRGKPRGRGRGSYRGASRGGRGASRGGSRSQYSYQTRPSQPTSGYRASSSSSRSSSDDQAPKNQGTSRPPRIESDDPWRQIRDNNNSRQPMSDQRMSRLPKIESDDRWRQMHDNNLRHPMSDRGTSRPPKIESDDPWHQMGDYNNERQPLSKLENGSRDNQTQRQRPPDPGNNNDQQFRVPRAPRGRGFSKARDVPPRFRRKSSVEERYSSEEGSGSPHEADVFQAGSTGTQDKEAIDRVSEILEESSSGVYMADIPKMYRERYNDSMGLDLIDKMAALDLCHKEKVLENHYIVYKKLTITAPRNRLAQRQVVESGNVSKPTETVREEPTSESYMPIMARSFTTLKAPTSLPELTLPEDDVIQVLVSLVYDTSHFYCYIVGEEYSDGLRDLEDRMKQFYADEEQLVLEGDPLHGHYYAARSGSDWLRAMVEGVRDGMALCRFADHGDKEEVELRNIKHLPKRFCALPQQAVLCSLANSPILPNTDRIILAFCRLALSRVVTAEVLRSIECCLDNLDYEEIPEIVVKRFVHLAMSSSSGCNAQIVSRDDPLRVILYSETRCINDILLNILMLERPE